MSKLEKSTFPAGHGPNDFKAFGPPATKDGEFDNCKIADMGSFSQEDKDSNKFYHAAVVQSKINGKWYTYFEWGRVGAKSPQFQLEECANEADAQRKFAAQCHEKNDKRGVWTNVAGIRTLTAKPGKDVYLVRDLATRSTGLPDAKTIKNTEGAKPKPSDEPTPNVVAAKVKAKKAASKKADPQTAKLLQDLIGGTISYTRGSMADDSIPTQNSIDTARIFLTEAQKRLLKVGDDIDEQIADKDLRTLSGELYKRIPKKKPVNAPDRTWILSSENISTWNQDLDCFESALSSQLTMDDSEVQADPFHGLPLHMEWIDPNTELGKFLYFWWPRASANRHYHLKDMKIKNMWKVDRHGDDEKFKVIQHKIDQEIKGNKIKERPLFQPSERFDVVEGDLFQRTNTALLHHGSRSVNISSILKTSFRQPKELVNVVISGAMFSGGGSGLYFADDMRKSAGYTSLEGSLYSGGSGGIPGRHAFMFGCDVVLGQPHIAPRSYPFLSPPKGNHCIFGMGKVHGKATNSGVENNEWIVFDSAQAKIRYLFEFAA